MATTNPWKQFSGLLPKSSRLIGTVSQHNGNGTSTSTVTLRNGSTIIAQGEAVPVNSNVLVQNGEIVRQVPDLQSFIAEV